MKRQALFYSLLAGAIFALDRCTKSYAMQYWRDEHVVNPYLYFQVTINRGISWGLLNYTHKWIFLGVTFLIATITVALMWYAYQRYQQGKSILGEVCVIAGSCSNIIDRIFYLGVVDFIVVHAGPWTWPVFNIADAFIVFGVAIMFIHLLSEHD